MNVMPAMNLPDYLEVGKLWVIEPDCPEDCYGILLLRGDYKVEEE